MPPLFLLPLLPLSVAFAQDPAVSTDSTPAPESPEALEAGEDAAALAPADTPAASPSKLEAQAAPDVPDPKASPITIPMSPDSPGPFKCSVDPYVALRQGETTQLSIRLHIDEEEHRLYRDRIAIDVPDPAGLEPGELLLPPGVSHTDQWGGPPRDVFDKDTEVFLELTAPTDLTGRVDMTIEVHWQGCSDSMCFVPASQTFNVPVRLKKAR